MLQNVVNHKNSQLNDLRNTFEEPSDMQNSIDQDQSILVEVRVSIIYNSRILV